MAEREASLSPARWFSPILVMIAITNIAVFWDVPVLRQVSGFAFLSFIPGFLFLSILKLNKLNLLERIVLSVGLSISFSMLFGIALNGSLLALGYTTPLSTASLLISFSIATGVMAVIAYVRNGGITFSFPKLRLTTREKALLIVPALFPLLSIFGMRMMNLNDNNAMLMLLLFLIPAYVIYIAFHRRQMSEKVYPLAIFLIGISLLLMYSLRSNHIIGSDVQVEYYTFMATVDNLKWSQLGFDLFDGCLITSLLPAIYQNFLNIGPEHLYKILYSLLFSVSPLVVYLIARKYIGSFYAFLASFLFMSQQIFLWTPGYARTNMAILFFALAIMTMFNDNISRFSKPLLFIIFTASIIVSHYGVAYATFFALILTWIGMRILPRIIPRMKYSATQSAGNQATTGQGRPSPRSDSPASTDDAQEPPRTWASKGVTITMITLFFAILFLWYSQMIGSTFSYGVRFVYNAFARWEWFLAGDVGGQPVQAALGRTLAILPQRIEFVFSWLTIVLMSLGLLTTIRRFRTMVPSSFAEQGKPGFLVNRFDYGYLALAISCYILLVASVVMPFVSEYYGTVKNYFQMTVPLSVFFVIGGVEIARYFKVRARWVIIAVLIPFFLSTTGAIYQAFGDPKAITLNSRGVLYSDMYLSDAESYSARWTKEYVEEGTIYVHGLTRSILLSQGKIPYRQTNPELISYHEEGKPITGYIYLRRRDLIDDEFVITYPALFAGKNKIYANGNSEVYR